MIATVDAAGRGAAAVVAIKIVDMTVTVRHIDAATGVTAACAANLCYATSARNQATTLVTAVPSLRFDAHTVGASDIRSAIATRSIFIWDSRLLHAVVVPMHHFHNLTVLI